MMLDKGSSSSPKAQNLPPSQRTGSKSFQGPETLVLVRYLFFLNGEKSFKILVAPFHSQRIVL